MGSVLYVSEPGLVALWAIVVTVMALTLGWPCLWWGVILIGGAVVLVRYAYLVYIYLFGSTYRFAVY